LEAAHHQNIGNSLLREGKLDEAAASYSRALKLNPDSFETINSLGLLLHKAGRLEQSAVCYQKAILIKPDFAEAHNNLGEVLKHLGRLDEAVASNQRAVFYMPDLAAAHCNLGDKLILRGCLQEAVLSLKRAIELQPRMVEAHLNLGNAYRGLGLLSEAVRSYKRAISIAPDIAAPYNNLADLYVEIDKMEDAVTMFQKALALDPHYAAAYSNMLYSYTFTGQISPQAERVLAEGWERSMLTAAERAAARQRALPGSGVFSVRPRQGRQLRLGIVSGDLGSHAVAYFLEPILEELDRSRFHLTLFPAVRRTCSRAERFRKLADGYISLAELSDSQAADRIRLEQIDVLVDASGHTLGGRLGIFAHRAAPVQCAYIGYCGTTGLTEMDWVFGQRSLADHFTERVWEPSPPGLCYRGEKDLPESSWMPDPEGTIWLGSFNRYGKIGEKTLSLWAKVLHALPEAKLLLEDGKCFEEETHQRILATLSALGVTEERVAFIPFIPGHQRHMDRYNRLDIALETIPFNGGTTAFDTLWMGVPLVGIEGSRAGGRMGSLILKAFDRPDWVARDEADYVSIVCRLARDLEERKKQRQGQRARMELSPLCDEKGITRSLEEGFEAMFDAWLAGARSEPGESADKL
jgi:predicted O-linked N-acetylglucosamine transferase (SPINDLY family)